MTNPLFSVAVPGTAAARAEGRAEAALVLISAIAAGDPAVEAAVDIVRDALCELSAAVFDADLYDDLVYDAEDIANQRAAAPQKEAVDTSRLEPEAAKLPTLSDIDQDVVRFINEAAKKEQVKNAKEMLSVALRSTSSAALARLLGCRLDIAEKAANGGSFPASFARKLLARFPLPEVTK